MKKIITELNYLNFKENIDPYSNNMRVMLEWRPLVYEDIKQGLYMISSLGRIYSFATNREVSYLYHIGYNDVKLQTESGMRKTYAVHRLVAYTFCENLDPINKDIINHKNTFKNDNAKYNLEFVTKEENNRHAVEFYKNNPHIQSYSQEELLKGEDNKWGRGDLTCGENNGMAKRTEAEVRAFCQAVQDGMFYEDALLMIGLPITDNNKSWAKSIIKRKRWKVVGNDYDFSNVELRRKR